MLKYFDEGAKGGPAPCFWAGSTASIEATGACFPPRRRPLFPWGSRRFRAARGRTFSPSRAGRYFPRPRLCLCRRAYPRRGIPRDARRRIFKRSLCPHPRKGGVLRRGLPLREGRFGHARALERKGALPRHRAAPCRSRRGEDRGDAHQTAPFRGEIGKVNALLCTPISCGGSGTRQGGGAHLRLSDRQSPPSFGQIPLKRGRVCGAGAAKNGEEYPAIVNFGPCPTFGVEARKTEAHLIGFEDDLYGEEVTLFPVRFLRPVRKFQSKEALETQLEADRAAALGLVGAKEEK